MISHCDGNREKEQVWSKMLRIMGDAKATAGAQMAVGAIKVCVEGACPFTRLLRQSCQLCLEGAREEGA